jgi:ATP-dependent RNA helicase MSS116
MTPINIDEKILRDQESAVRNFAHEDVDNIAKVYQSWLGYYNSRCSKMRISKIELVQLANEYASQVFKINQILALERKTVGKMGLKEIPGLNIK